MITRGVRAAALLALFHAETDYWEVYPQKWRDLEVRWIGYQWNMVRHMVQDCLWDELVYHLTHNLRDMSTKEEILHVLWQSAPRLCQTLGLDNGSVKDSSSKTVQRHPSSVSMVGPYGSGKNQHV